MSLIVDIERILQGGDEGRRDTPLTALPKIDRNFRELAALILGIRRWEIVTPYDFEGSSQTLRIERLVDYLKANGGEGLIPPGVWSLTAPLSVASGLKPFRLRGAGRHLTWLVRAAAIGTPIEIEATDGLTISDLTIDGGFAEFPVNANHGLVAFNLNDFLLQRVDIRNWKNTPALIYATTPGLYSGNVVDDCRCFGNDVANNGWFVGDMLHSGIRGSFAEGCLGDPGYGLQLKNDNSYCFIENSGAKRCSGGVVFGQDTGVSATKYARVRSVTVEDCGGGFAAGHAVGCEVDILIDHNGRTTRAFDIGDGCLRNTIRLKIERGTAANQAGIIRSGAFDNYIELTGDFPDGVPGQIIACQSDTDRNAIVIRRLSGVSVPTGNVQSRLSNLGGTGNTLVIDQLPTTQRATIAAGVITVAGPHVRVIYVDTEGAASTDDLVTINGGTEGQVITIQSTSDNRDVVLKHNTGNILVSGASDFTLDRQADAATFVYTSITSKWVSASPPANNQT